VLSEQHGKKYAEIVNEFGELGIDNELVVNATEEVLEMNNGRFDAILIETTGLADPAPVAPRWATEGAGSHQDAEIILR
jgi:G3E family GTPase